MIAALDLLASLPGRHVAILGEMLELGEASVAEHRRVADYARRHADLFIGVGPYGDEPRGSPDRHAYACAGGNRASWRGGGCSAGTFSCS